MHLDGAADYCYITTTGRVTGRDHTVEIWFGLEGNTLFVLAGGRERSDFVRNLMKDPRCTVRIGRRDAAPCAASARVIDGGDEDRLARALLLQKYSPANGGLEEWGQTALAVAFDMEYRASM